MAGIFYRTALSSYITLSERLSLTPISNMGALPLSFASVFFLCLLHPVLSSVHLSLSEMLLLIYLLIFCYYPLSALAPREQ